ncbi:MAG: hypothetical protein ACRETL_11045, partial [Gammaproteobacteria bacterium]
MRRRLLELGCPAKATRRIVREASEHLDDLRQAVEAQGQPATGAATLAAEQFGDPIALAERHVEALRNSSWFTRHCFITFGIMPVAIMLGIGTLCWCFDGGKILWADPWEYIRYHAPWIYLWMSAIFWGSLMVVTALLAFYFCWAAQRFAVARRWLWVMCGVLAAHNLFVQVKTVQWASLSRGFELMNEPTALDDFSLIGLSAPSTDW